MGGQERGHVIWKREAISQMPGAQKVGKQTEAENPELVLGNAGTYH